MKFADQRRDVAYFMRRLYRQQLTTTSGGNISCRLPDGAMAITPSKLDKAKLRTAQIAVIAADGVNRTPELTPSIETQMHQAVYAARPDVSALVHAHPTVATAFTASGRDIRCDLIAESFAVIGRPITAPYACMGSPELAENVAATAAETDAILLANHGIMALGDSLLAAFDRLELIEAAARMTLVVEQLGDIQPLPPAQREELDMFMGRSTTETEES